MSNDVGLYNSEIDLSITADVNNNITIFLSKEYMNNVRGSCCINIKPDDIDTEYEADIYIYDTNDICRNIQLDSDESNGVSITMNKLKNIDVAVRGQSGTFLIDFKAIITYE